MFNYLNYPLAKICFLFLLFSCQDSNKSKQIDNQKTDSTAKFVGLKDDFHNVLDSTDTTFYVYLTFDDGPYHTSPNLAKYLDQNKIKSSFFVIGSQICYSKNYDSIFQWIKSNSLFRVYNHTFSHAITKGRVKGYYKNPVSVYQDIVKNKQFLPEGNHITRLPGTCSFRVGDYRAPSNNNGKRMINYLDSMHSNEILFGWDISWSTICRDDIRSIDSMLFTVSKIKSSQNKFHNHVVILFHDFFFNTPKSFENLTYLLEKLQNNYHCVFRWASEFPGC